MHEGEHKNIDKMLEFNDFLAEDPKEELLQSGIYEFIKGWKLVFYNIKIYWCHH